MQMEEITCQAGLDITIIVLLKKIKKRMTITNANNTNVIIIEKLTTTEAYTSKTPKY